MKKIFNYANILLLISIVALDICYILLGGLLLKGITSAVFVLTGFVNLIFAFKNKTNLKFSWFLLTGLVFAMAGDVVLNIHFIAGAILFAIGHIFYFISYCLLHKICWLDLLIGLMIFVPSMLFITLAPLFDFGGVLMEVVCVTYALIISLMVGKSVSNFVKTKSLLNFSLMFGSILFFFSDLMLLLNVFASLGKVVSVLCLATYYPAQFILAYSIFIRANQ